MKSTALYVYIAFLHSLMLAAPVTLENNLEPRASGSMPYSGTVSVVRPEIFRRGDQAVGNETPIPVSSQTTTTTTLFTSELAELLRLNRAIPSNQINRQDKPKIPRFLRRLSENLEAANSRGDSYSTKNGIHNAVQELLNGILNNVYWIKGKLRRDTIIFSMRCLKQTKPPNGISKLPRESDLKELSGRINRKDERLTDHRWTGLVRFLGEIEWIMQRAKEETFVYDKGVVNEALVNAQNAVKVWNDGSVKSDVLSILDRCLELNR
ncbi:hypothetical protein H0H93_003189 [Arthromyces matolae]|nr:hypothetical protein H0H93_003189 [Arthromyces matolae]